MWWTAVFEEQWTVSLLPASSSTPWERALDAVDGDLAARDPVGLIPAARSDKDVPLAWLPYLAAERSVDEFIGTWPESRQRAVVAGSFAVHQRKGVRRGLDLALAPLGYRAKVVEWFEQIPPRPAYTFRVRVELGPDATWRASDHVQVVRTANSAKNAHTKMEAIEAARMLPSAATHIGGVIRRTRAITVGQLPKQTSINPPDAYTFVGATFVRRRVLVIGTP